MLVAWRRDPGMLRRANAHGALRDTYRIFLTSTVGRKTNDYLFLSGRRGFDALDPDARPSDPARFGGADEEGR